MEGGMYNEKAAVGLGTTQMILGFFCILMGSQALEFQVNYTYWGYGIWCGIVAVISGILTLSSTCCGHVAMIYISVVGAIIELLASLALMGLSIFSFVYYPESDYYNYYGPYTNCQACNYQSYGCSSAYYCSMWTNGAVCLTQTEENISIWILSLLITASVFSAGIAIATASLACSCCLLKDGNKVYPSVRVQVRSDNVEPIVEVVDDPQL